MKIFGSVFLGLALAVDALAFPEMVRHGYVNCTSCHISPTGGGVLSQYGRELSKELLSTWAIEGEQRPFYFFDSPEWLAIGGDVRAIQIYRNTPRIEASRFFVMQADFEAAVSEGPWTLSITGGVQETPIGLDSRFDLLSRRYYLIYRPSEEIAIRGGKFMHAFGIQNGDHVTAVKRGLQINDQGSETYNMEASWNGEIYGITGTAILGRFDSLFLEFDAVKRERGFSFQATRSLLENSKVGLNYLYGTKERLKRDVLGPFGVLAFNEHLFLVSEWDFQKKLSKWGMAALNRLQYEFIQGFHGYLSQEYLDLDFTEGDDSTKTYGIGLQIFPRPHWEIVLSWQKTYSGGSPDSSDFGKLLLHFYP